ncbi:hypothetical protein RF11_10541 [Thelohanellus kitauei]|uniref:Uncharacterized protein n=1 Tax=Thelohanellus kitauei TaxID=669202 RepID=A0A0C2JTN9_THEKT|nr:hypothetical protein RF11_10541 [Thelohanellus kitauei]
MSSWNCFTTPPTAVSFKQTRATVFEVVSKLHDLRCVGDESEENISICVRHSMEEERYYDVRYGDRGNLVSDKNRLFKVCKKALFSQFAKKLAKMLFVVLFRVAEDENIIMVDEY